MAHPPGIATRACPKRANSGPITTIDARILLTYSKAAVVVISFVAFNVIAFSSSSNVLNTFRLPNTFNIICTSDKLGTFVKCVTPFSAKILAARIGNTAFLAPSTFTVP